MDARATYEYCASKGDFISLEGTGRFLLPPKNIPNLNFPPITVNSLFKFSAQDRDLKYFFGEVKFFQYLLI